MRILKASDIYKNHSSFLLNKVKRGTLHHSFLMKVVFETVKVTLNPTGQVVL